MTKPKRRYWTQFGYTKEQAAVNYEGFIKKPAPWSSQTKYYMEDLIHKSSIFQIHESLFFNESHMECTLFTSNHYNFKHSFARIHHLGFYFDHELK